MEIPQAVARQLHILSTDGDRGDGFVAGLDRLGAELTHVVPSLLAVSLTLVRLGYDVAVTTLAPHGETARVASSLAVPLTSGDAGDALLMQAGDEGAFLLLADDLTALVRPGSPPLQVDRHLVLPATAPAMSIESVLAELRTINQAIGTLIDRGLTPEAAIVDLDRRAAAMCGTTGAASHRLLADLSPTEGTGSTAP